MRAVAMKLQLTGAAHRNFDSLHSLLENDFLTITSRGSSDLTMTTDLRIIAGYGTDLPDVVGKAVEKINTLYPGCVNGVVVEYDNSK